MPLLSSTSATSMLPGNGVPSDPAEAVKWYPQGRRAGVRQGQVKLGWAYSDGKAEPKIRRRPRNGFARPPSKAALTRNIAWA